MLENLKLIFEIYAINICVPNGGHKPKTVKKIIVVKICPSFKN